MSISKDIVRNKRRIIFMRNITCMRQLLLSFHCKLPEILTSNMICMHLHGNSRVNFYRIRLITINNNNNN